MPENADALEKIIDVIETNKADETSGNGSVVGSLIVGVFAVLVVAVLAYQAWKQGKKAAKALHEAAVLKEEGHQAEVDADLQELQEEAEKALEKASEKYIESTKLKEKAKRFQEERDKAVETIRKVTSWEELNEKLGK